MEKHELKQISPDYSEKTGNGTTQHHTLLEERIYPEVKKGKLIARIVGYVGLLLAVLSLFFYAYVIGAIAIVCGFFAQRKGEITFGAWAIAIGALSIIMEAFIVPNL